MSNTGVATMSSRKKKDKRKKKKRGRTPLARVRPDGLPAGMKVIVDPPGQIKMSQALWDFVEPWMDQWKTEDQLHKLLSLATIGWNAGIIPLDKRTAFIDDMANTIPPNAREAMRSIVAEMVKRKEKYFAHIKRMIISYDLRMMPTGPYLEVVSSLDVD
jgi:hypothetical protein